MVVDCLLPAQVRRLGAMTYAAARKAIKTSTMECEARGGEYVAFDRASHATTLKVWLPLAQEGDPEAQTYIGEAFEKGLGVAPDYATAADWYLRAAEQGFARAAIDLGNLFEQGLGLERDLEMARFWYRRASGVEGIESPLSQQASPANRILIIEPELEQRGVGIASRVSKPDDAVLVVGQVAGATAVASVSLNDTPAQVVGNMFRGTIVAPDGFVEVNAIDTGGVETRLRFRLPGRGDPEARPAPEPADAALGTIAPSPAAAKGHYHALVIGNNHYAHLPGLDTAVADARAVAALLQDHYGFSVRLMIDADRYAILSVLNDFRRELRDDDRVLVYYAGHGELDRVNRRGHWLPVDAEPDNPANWIANTALTDLFNIIPAHQLLVIADSCYSGMMSRSALGIIDAASDTRERLRLLQALSGARARTALTSGGVAPVLDGLGGRHSVFANRLLAALDRNQGALTGYELYLAIAPEVKETAARSGFVQTPEYAPLKFAGHEAGDFVFYRKQ